MELTVISTLIETLGMPAAIVVIGIFVVIKISNWFKVQYEENDTERKDNIEKYFTTIIENNVKLLELQENTNAILENSTKALQNNSTAFNNFSENLNIIIRTK